MTLEERIPLAALTTFRVGGPARIVASCDSEDDLRTALALSRERGLPFFVVGGGSNLLASDKGYEGVVIRPLLVSGAYAIAYEDQLDGSVIVTAGAGISWDALVDDATARGLWGLENLAGIPGSVGAAPVQNIGAYGAEARDTLAWVEALDTNTGELRRFANAECAFGYRDSRFKRDASLIITKVAFNLSRAPQPKLSYKDLAAAKEAGASLERPAEIAAAVRSIRSKKFPDLNTTGTAGSFFKNPIIAAAAYGALAERYPGIPGFPQGSEVKVPLAWILDRALSLKGFSMGRARLFEAQPLVLVAEQGAHADDIDALAKEVEKRVHDATGIAIEREVRALG